MVAVKSHQADAFLKSPRLDVRAILFFGTDAGLVSERASAAARAWANIEDPAGEIIRIDETDLENEPDRLIIELDTMAMFGGRKVVRVSAGRKINGAMLKGIVAQGVPQSVLVVDAGNLKPTDAMRKAFEAAPYGAAVGCYPDESKDLVSVVNEVLGAAGLSISPEVRDALVSRLGADRALSRAEVEKLALYCRGREQVTIDDVEAIVGDSSELTIERIITAAASGNGSAAAVEFGRYSASGESVQAVAIALQRYFDRLHKVRCDLDAGRQIGDALRGLRPPIHFKQRNVFSAQCRAWSLEKLSRVNLAISSCIKATRRTGAMDQILLERLLLSIAQMGRVAGRR